MESDEKESSFKNFLAVNTTGGARWHPDENRIVFINDAPGNYQLFSTEIKKNELIKSLQITENVNRSTDPRFLKDGTIVFQRDEEGDENFQIYLLDEERKEYQLTSDPKAKHIISSASDKYLY